MGAPPVLTPQQRADALAKAAASRKRRAEVKSKIKSGDYTIDTVLEIAHTDDAVAKILRVMDGDNPGPINIGRQGAISVKEVVSICNSHLGISPRLEMDLNAPIGVLSRDCSNARFWSLYGVMEPTDYVTGFGQLIDEIEKLNEDSDAA